MVLLASDVAGQHGHQLVNDTLAQTRRVVPISAARRLADAKPLVDVVSEEAQEVAAAVALKYPRAGRQTK